MPAHSWIPCRACVATTYLILHCASQAMTCSLMNVTLCLCCHHIPCSTLCLVKKKLPDHGFHTVPVLPSCTFHASARHYVKSCSYRVMIVDTHNPARAETIIPQQASWLRAKRTSQAAVRTAASALGRVSRERRLCAWIHMRVT